MFLWLDSLSAPQVMVLIAALAVFGGLLCLGVRLWRESKEVSDSLAKYMNYNYPEDKNK